MAYAEFAVPSVFKLLLAFLSKNEDVSGMDLPFVRKGYVSLPRCSVDQFSVIHRFPRECALLHVAWEFA